MLLRTKATTKELLEQVFVPREFRDPDYKKELKNTVFIVYRDWTYRSSNYLSISVLIEDLDEYRDIHYIIGGLPKSMIGDMGTTTSRQRQLFKALDNNDIAFEILEGYHDN